MPVQSSVGIKFSIGPAAATNDIAGFDAVAFDFIGEVTDIGAFGKSFDLVTHIPVDTGDTNKFKGANNNGSTTIQFALDDNDAGQIALRVSANSLSANNSFKLEKQDGAIVYFDAKTMSFMNTPGGASSIDAGEALLEITKTIVLKPAP